MVLEKTKVFYDELKRMSFWKRLFGWGKITSLLMESYSEIEAFSSESSNAGSLNSQIENLKSDLEDKKNTLQKNEIKIKGLETKLDSLQRELTIKEKSISKLEATRDENSETISNLKGEKKTLEARSADLTKEIKNLSNQVSQYEKVKDIQQNKYDEMIAKLEKREETLERRRQQLEDEETAKETNRFEEMKKTWKQHEDLVEQAIKAITHKYAIEYFDKEKVPFKGKPDNTIQLAGEFVIFDAKAPANDNLNNFPTYIKTQAESLKKYAKQQDVKKDIFLVVPTNTIDQIKQKYYNLSDYRVFVIAIDSLEPIILALRKIEDYEFIDQMTPEQREDIARIIGKFAHNSKRRMQIDAYLADQTIDLLRECGRLPEDILESSQKHEMSLKLNPPMEKRAKKTDLKKLADNNKKLKKELQAQNVNTKVKQAQIEQIDLYGKDEN